MKYLLFLLTFVLLTSLTNSSTAIILDGRVMIPALDIEIIQSNCHVDYIQEAGGYYVSQRTVFLIEIFTDKPVAVEEIAFSLGGRSSGNKTPDRIELIAQNSDAEFIEENGDWYSVDNEFLLFTWQGFESAKNSTCPYNKNKM